MKKLTHFLLDLNEFLMEAFEVENQCYEQIGNVTHTSRIMAHIPKYIEKTTLTPSELITAQSEALTAINELMDLNYFLTLRKGSIRYIINETEKMITKGEKMITKYNNFSKIEYDKEIDQKLKPFKTAIEQLRTDLNLYQEHINKLGGELTQLKERMVQVMKSVDPAADIDE